MRIRRLLFLVGLLSLTITGIAQEKVRLALAYPTVKNIKTFNYLIENKYIDLPSVEIVALCYAHDTYNYNLTKAYVRDNFISNVEFIDIEDKLEPDDLFKENDCTVKFYEIFTKTDGIIFPGGDDLPPNVYGEETSIKTSLENPGRHYFELSLLYHLYGGYQKSDLKPFLEQRPNYCILGICLGAQTMSTAAGGTMIQDIPSEIYSCETYDAATKLNAEELHRNPWYFMYAGDDLLSCSFHHIVMNTAMKERFKMEPKVLSCHHQSIEKPGKGFEPWAWSTDRKVIEAIQHQKYPNVFAVQFHPEATILYTKSMYKLEPKGEFVNIPDLLSENDKKFHKEFWTYYSEKLKASVAKK
jgi:putative glutamine amidotransferase